MASKAPPLDAETTKRLQHDLIRLGDMMGDGLHHEPDGRWIVAAYRRVSRALGHSAPRRNNGVAINQAMTALLQVTPCPKCGGVLKQTRSGSKRAQCGGCGALFQGSRKAKGGAM